MPKKLFGRKFCPTCLVIGGSFLCVSTIALAQSATPSATSSAPWWFTGLIGVLTLVIGAYVRGLEAGITEAKKATKEGLESLKEDLEKRIDRVDHRAGSTSDRLLGDYHDKDELREVIKQEIGPLVARLVHVENAVEKVHSRLDSIKLARITGQHPAVKS